MRRGGRTARVTRVRSVRDSHQRFLRFAYPEEVLVGRTLQAQGESLGHWVVETYEALHEAGPPPELTTAGSAGS